MKTRSCTLKYPKAKPQVGGIAVTRACQFWILDDFWALKELRVP